MYFLYSKEQLNTKNETLSKIGKRFEPGVVVVNGKKQKFTQMSTNPGSMSRYVDTKIVAHGDTTRLTYTEPKTVLKREEN